MTTEELYKLQNLLQKLIQTGVSLEDILVNGSSGVHIEYIDKDCLIDKALTADPDNVAALYLQEKATFLYQNTKKSNKWYRISTAWYRIGATIMLPQDIHDKLANSNSLSENSDILLNYMKTHPENIVLFDGETYSPEGCVELVGLGEDYKFYNEEH